MTNPMWPLINGFRQFLECAPLGQLYLLHVHVHVGVPANKLQKMPEKVHQDAITDLSYFRVLLILQCVVLTQHKHADHCTLGGTG